MPWTPGLREVWGMRQPRGIICLLSSLLPSFLSFLFGGPPKMEVSGPGVELKLQLAGPHCIHKNIGSEPHLRPTLLLTAMPDPEPTE